MVAAGACGGDSAVNPFSDSIVGNYYVRTINGVALPVSFQQNGQTILLTQIGIFVAESGSWKEEYSYKLTSGGQTTAGSDVDGGTWSRAGASVTLTSFSGTGYVGKFTGTSLELLDNHFSTFVFDRQR